MLTHHQATLLGDIPQDWDRTLLSDLLGDQQAGDWGDEHGEIAIRVLRSTNFTKRGILDFSDVESRRFPLSSAGKMNLKENDLLIERSGGGVGQAVGRVGFIQKDLPGHWFSNFVQLLRADSGKINPAFLGWLLYEVNRSGLAERLQTQTTQMRNLDLRDYLRIWLPKPPPNEQRVITRTISIADQAMHEAERKLLTAQRLKMALMQQLFTRGMPGRHKSFTPITVFRHQIEVPRDWDPQRLGKSVCMVEYGTNEPSNSNRRGYPVVAIPEVISSRFQLGECSYAEVPDSEASALRLAPDDVLLVRTNGNAEYIGKSTVIGPEAAIRHIIYASYLIRVRTVAGELSGRYLNYFLASPLGRRQCNASANTSAGNHNLGARSMRQFLLPRPNPSEQAEIVQLIDAAEDHVEAIEAEISSLERLKTSLLQNLLTGEVRIQGGEVA